MCGLNEMEDPFERKGGRESHIDTAEKSPQDSVEGRGSEEAGSSKEEAGSLSQRDCETSGARIIVAMVPCMRLYAFLGAELSKGRELEGHPYREWIETYASPAFQVRNALLLRLLGTQYVFFSAQKGRMAVRRIMYLMFPRLNPCFLSVLSDGCSLEWICCLYIRACFYVEREHSGQRPICDTSVWSLEQGPDVSMKHLRDVVPFSPWQTTANPRRSKVCRI
jgi:hypothetical protein